MLYRQSAVERKARSADVRFRAGCMSSQQYRDIIKKLGLTHPEAAGIMGCDQVTSRRHANGTRKVPGSVESLLRLHEKSGAVAVDGESLPKRDHSIIPPEMEGKVAEINGKVVQFLQPVDVNLDMWLRGETVYEGWQVLTAATQRFHKRYVTLAELVLDILDGKTAVTEREIHPSVLLAATADSAVPSIRSRGAKPISGATRTTASRSLRRQLSELGYTEHAISNMDPAEGHERVINAIPPENLGVALELASVDVWSTAMNRIKQTKFDVNPNEIKLITNVVTDIMEVDPNGNIFRYPESIKGDRHLKDWAIVNLAVVGDVFSSEPSRFRRRGRRRRRRQDGERRVEPRHTDVEPNGGRSHLLGPHGIPHGKPVVDGGDGVPSHDG